LDCARFCFLSQHCFYKALPCMHLSSAWPSLPALWPAGIGTGEELGFRQMALAVTACGPPSPECAGWKQARLGSTVIPASLCGEERTCRGPGWRFVALLCVGCGPAVSSDQIDQTGRVCLPVPSSKKAAVATALAHCSSAFHRMWDFLSTNTTPGTTHRTCHPAPLSSRRGGGPRCCLSSSRGMNGEERRVPCASLFSQRRRRGPGGLVVNEDSWCSRDTGKEEGRLERATQPWDIQWPLGVWLGQEGLRG
jgi:hypothetical protein